MVLCLKIWKSRTLPGLKIKIMKIASSLKSLKKRDLNSKLVKRRGKLYVINKKIQNLKLAKGKLNMSENDFKKTYSGFTKFVLWGTLAVIAMLVLLAITLL